MKVVALSGGTGSAKLLRGLARLPIELSVVCNVGDDFVWQGLNVCPDIDIAMYALAGTGDSVRGWGLEGDAFGALEELKRLGLETWFRMGDRDLVTSILRTDLLRRGRSLTDATEQLRRMHGVDHRVLPVTDDRFETHVVTPGGDLHLQEFWVRDRGRPRILGVVYQGKAKAEVTSAVRNEIGRADRVLICPANPVSSIGPMLAVRGFRKGLEEAPGRVVALSPMIGKVPFSGPAGRMMRAMGIRTDSVGVARLYSDFLDVLLMDRSDGDLKEGVARAGVAPRLSDTTIEKTQDALRLAREMLAV